LFLSIVGVAFSAVALQHLVRLTKQPPSLCDASAQAGVALLDLPLMLLAAFGSVLAQQRRRLNTRLGVQYTFYDKFNGRRRNFDLAGANAADNDALRVFAWVAF
jgi:hypothetical protein